MSLSLKKQNFKRFSQLNLKAEFNNNTVTSNATFTYIEALKRIIGFKELLESVITYKKAPNAQFTTATVLDYIIL